MVHRGERSPEAIQRREQKKAARKYVIDNSFNDTQLAETVSRTEPEEVQAFLGATFGFCDQTAVPCAFSGVVLTDGRGQGVFQR
jgi:hypothetical protein